jgi:tetratricopeptide (TPR) repeat protein
MIKRKFSNLNKEIIQHKLFMPILVLVGILLVFPFPIRMVHSLYLQARLSEAIDLLNSGRNEINGFLYTCEPLDEIDSETERFVKQIISEVTGSISPTKWNPHTYLQLGRLYCMHGEPAQALEYYQQFIDMRPSNPLGHLEIGFVFEKLGDAEGATSQWKLAGIDHNWMNNVGTITWNAGDYNAALLWFTRALWIEPNSPDIWIKIANIHTVKDNLDEAQNALWEAYEFDPESSTSPLVEILINMGLYSESRELLEEALANYDNSDYRSHWWSNLAQIYSEMELWDEVIEVYQKAISEYPDEIELYISLGWVYYDYRGDFESAINQFNQVIEISPDQGTGYFAMGLLFNRQQKYDEAELWFSEASAKEPERTHFILIRANNLRNAGNLDKSIILYNNVLHQNPRNSRAYYELSHAYFLLEEYEIAKEYIENAIKFMEISNQFYYNRAGRIYEALGDYNSAISYYKKSLEIDPMNNFSNEGISRITKIIED